MIKDYGINIEKAVSVTGHRVMPLNFDKDKLKDIFVGLINDGYDTFLIGMAIGFDTLCFQTLLKLKKTYNGIKLIACIPCLNQSKLFSDKDKKEYARLIELADEKIYVTDTEYTNTCMMQRNRFMVDNSSVLVSYVTKNFGGSFATTNYAIKKNKQIVKL